MKGIKKYKEKSKKYNERHKTKYRSHNEVTMWHILPKKKNYIKDIIFVHCRYGSIYDAKKNKLYQGHHICTPTLRF